MAERATVNKRISVKCTSVLLLDRSPERGYLSSFSVPYDASYGGCDCALRGDISSWQRSCDGINEIGCIALLARSCEGPSGAGRVHVGQASNESIIVAAPSILRGQLGFCSLDTGAYPLHGILEIRHPIEAAAPGHPGKTVCGFGSGLDPPSPRVRKT